MSRSETTQDQQFQQREGGKTWDTLKPLASNGLDLTSTLLIDDSPHKVFPGEERNVILLPEYTGGAEATSVLETLVDLLISVVANARDVRLVTAMVQTTLDTTTGRLNQPLEPSKPLSAPPSQDRKRKQPAVASGANAMPVYPAANPAVGGALGVAPGAVTGLGVNQLLPIAVMPTMGYQTLVGSAAGGMGHMGVGLMDNSYLGDQVGVPTTQVAAGQHQYDDLNQAFHSFWHQSDMHVLLLQWMKSGKEEELQPVDIGRVGEMEPHVHKHMVAVMRAAMVVLLTVPKGVPETELWDIILVEQTNNPFRNFPTKGRSAKSKAVLQGLIDAGGVLHVEMSWLWGTLQPCYSTVPGFSPRNEHEAYLLSVLRLLEELDGVAASQLMRFLQGLHPLLSAYFPADDSAGMQKLLATNAAASYFKVPAEWEAHVHLSRKRLKTFLCITNVVIDVQPLQESIEVMVRCHESLLGRSLTQGKKKRRKKGKQAENPEAAASQAPDVEFVGEDDAGGVVVGMTRQDSEASWQMNENDDVEMADGQGLVMPVQSGMSRERLCPDELEEATCLHPEMLEFANACLPSEEHLADVMATLRVIEDAARSVWPQAQAVVFGSQATGLALPGSDLDVVLLGVAGYELRTPADGFSKSERGDIIRLLQMLIKSLRTTGALRYSSLISRARIPIVKCALNVGPGIAADISIGTRNGGHAVLFLQQLIREMPPLRPICLIVKAFLKERKLNEVFKGGLSSWSLVNMVVTHLICEGFPFSQELPPADAEIPAFPVQVLRELRNNSADGVDLAWLVWSFFERFGNLFDYYNDAISIMQGGVRAKDPSWTQGKQAKGKLCVEDPQQAGRDIAAGTHEVQRIVLAFQEAAAALRPFLKPAHKAPPPPGSTASWAAVQSAGTHQSVPDESPFKDWRMNAFLDVRLALEHSTELHEQRLLDHLPTVGGNKNKNKKKKKSKAAQQQPAGRPAGRPGGVMVPNPAALSQAPAMSLPYATPNMLMVAPLGQPFVGQRAGNYGLGLRVGGVQKQSGYPQPGFGPPALGGQPLDGGRKKKNRKKKKGGQQGQQGAGGPSSGAPNSWHGF